MIMAHRKLPPEYQPRLSEPGPSNYIQAADSVDRNTYRDCEHFCTASTQVSHCLFPTGNIKPVAAIILETSQFLYKATETDDEE